MWLICITHASARDVAPRHIFRGLSEAGRDEVKTAVVEFQKTLPAVAPALGSEALAIGKIVTSPMARCLETVLLFADELRAFTKTSEIHVSEQLKERRGEQLRPDDLVAVVENERASVILLGTHGDLAGALPLSATLASDASDKGFFTSRPVVVVINYEPGTSWESARVLYCQGYKSQTWRNLLAAQVIGN